MNTEILDLKRKREDSLLKGKVNFRYTMGIAEIFAPFFIQSIPAALTIVSIGNLFPTLLHIEGWLAWTLAWFVGIGMELLGLVSVDVYFEAKSYNQKYKEDKEKAPEGAALLVMIVYAVTALVIVVFLKMFPQYAIWSLIPLTLMSILIVSSVTMKKRLDELLLQHDQNVITVDSNVTAMLDKKIENVIEMLYNKNDKIQMLEEQIENVIETLDNKKNEIEILEQNVIDLSRVNTENVNNIQALESSNNEITLLHEMLSNNNNEITYLRNEITTLREMLSNNNNVMITKKKNVIEKKKQDDITKMSKEQKMKLLIDYLIDNYDGAETDTIVNSRVAENLSIDQVTVGRYIKELKSSNKLNGHVDANLLRAI